MPPTLSPAGRLRSRTSDISDLLRGRHDAKTSTDSQQRPPPIPTHLAEPVTPTTKPKGKFSFLGRKRKPSAVSPSSARVANDAVAVKQGQEGEGTLQSSSGLDRVNAPTGPGVSPPANKASLPPLNVSPPSFGLPQLEGSSSKATSASSPQLSQRIPSGIPTATLRNLRPQKSTSFESSRQSNDSQGRKQSSSSARPIITISPPHNIAEGATEKFHSPRSAPRPPGQGSARHSNQSGIPNSNFALGDRGGPDSPSSEVPSSATSVHSSTHFPIPSVDGPLATTSYKEESLLRKDHFEIGTPEPQASQRRGTVSGTHQLAGGSVGRTSVQDHQRRRHVSVLHLSNVKQDAPSSSLPRARRSGAASDSTTSGNESTASSHRTVSSMTRSKSSSSPGAKRVPPPLSRTWHTPPTTGPPTEPLPSPPASATLQPLILSSASRSSITPSPPSPVTLRKSLPPVPPKDTDTRPDGAQTPTGREDTLPSPARGEHDKTPTPTASPSTASSPAPRKPSPTRTPLREDTVKKLLADENATAEELREALRTQSAKYTRLMSYLLTLTERHGMEKHEFLRRIETLEQDARRRERELKGLRWIVANSSQSQLQSLAQKSAEAKENLLSGPARSDSGTLPKSEARSRQRSCSESVLTSNRASPNVLSPRSGTAGSLDSVGRRSIESPTGSTEEGLFELQSSIAEFIAPFRASPPPAVETQPQERPAKAKLSALSPSARLKRSNTLPDSPIQLPTVVTKQKQARRTSSPVLPVSAKVSPKTTPTASRSSSLRKTGLGIAVDMPASESIISSPPASEGRSDRNSHARMDSSTLSSIPSLSTLHTSSSGLSSIPETPRTDAGFSIPASPTVSVSDDAAMRRKKSEETKPSRTFRRQSTSSLSSSTSSGSGSASYATSSRVSASPSIAQVLDRTSRQPEMDAILRKLRAFGHHGSP